MTATDQPAVPADAAATEQNKTGAAAPSTRSIPPQNGPHVGYLNRRETHTSRAVLAVIVALVVIAALGYLITEQILSILGYDPLLLSPNEMVTYVVSLADRQDLLIPASVIAAGVIIGLIGLYLILKAILPGALRRHVMQDQRMAIVVDDAVIAAAVSRAVRRQQRLDSGQVTTSVRRHHITANITPTSGRPITDAEIEQFVTKTTSAWDLKPKLKVHANISAEGVVGR